MDPVRGLQLPWGLAEPRSRPREQKTLAASETVIDHDRIKRWAEARKARPACITGTGHAHGISMIRLDFPDYVGGDSLEAIGWDEWFTQFDEQKLALVIQRETADGQRSTFNKLVSREFETTGTGR